MSVTSYIFDSNATVAVATIITGLAAFFVYRRQRRDAKRDAANTVLMEIKSAERKLIAIKDRAARDKMLPENEFVMRSESWSRYKYLFISDLDRDDWDSISEFYYNCQLYDEILRKNGDAFGKNEEQIRSTGHRLLEIAAGSMIDEIIDNPTVEAAATAKYNQRAALVNDLYLSSRVHKALYTPQKYYEDGQFFLDALPTDISQKSPGAILKHIARLDD
jgi:hypothetical protein